jgi:DHA1 family bicyclomycin/chloramphenicol resistance-like MFS transporter
MSQTHNRTLIIVILGALSTISPFAIDMYLPAFPQVAAALHTSTARISLSLASYFAGMAAGQLFYGPLLDRFGRKLPLYAGLVLFIAASLLCLGSRTVEWLIALRFVQGLGGCGAQVAAMAMVRDFFPARETAKIISLLILIISASPLLAPSVGVFVSRASRLAMGLHRPRRVCGRDAVRLLVAIAAGTPARPHRLVTAAPHFS